MPGSRVACFPPKLHIGTCRWQIDNGLGRSPALGARVAVFQVARLNSTQSTTCCF